MGFKENHMNRIRDMGEKVLCTLRKVPFIIDRSWPNVRVLCPMGA